MYYFLGFFFIFYIVALFIYKDFMAVTIPAVIVLLFYALSVFIKNKLKH